MSTETADTIWVAYPGGEVEALPPTTQLYSGVAIRRIADLAPAGMVGDTEAQQVDCPYVAVAGGAAPIKIITPEANPSGWYVLHPDGGCKVAIKLLQGVVEETAVMPMASGVSVEPPTAAAVAAAYGKWLGDDYDPAASAAVSVEKIG